MKYKIKGLFVGKIAKFSNDFESAIRKYSVDKIKITQSTIENDEVANTKHHGGEMRVVHHYSNQNYNFLKEKFPEIQDRFTPGSFGENILTDELTESELFVGDIFQLGKAKLQLTVPRRPCATINYSYGDSRVLAEVIRTGHVGWFYKVLEEGEVKVSDELILLERSYPHLCILKLHQQGYGTPRFNDFSFLKGCLNTNLMDKGWAAKLTEVVKT